MNQLERESKKCQAIGHIEKQGKNIHDGKSMAAYERFKRPLYHLKFCASSKRPESNRGARDL